MGIKTGHTRGACCDCITDGAYGCVTPIENDILPAALSLQSECIAGVHEPLYTATHALLSLLFLSQTRQLPNWTASPHCRCQITS